MCKEAQAADESQEKMNWESLDGDTIFAKFNEVRDGITNLVKEMEKLTKDGYNHDPTETKLKLVRDQLLSPSGWFQSFVSQNINSFPDVKPDAKGPVGKPDWYYTLLPDRRKKYDDVSEYMADAAELQPFVQRTQELLAKLPFDDTFRCLLIYNNLKAPKIKFDDETYKRINDDIEAFSAQMRMSWDELESQAVKSKQYYASHNGQMDPKDMKEPYLQERKSDYSEVIRKRLFYDRLYYQGNGLYSLKSEYATRMSVLDQYSAKIVELRDEHQLKSKLEAFLEDSQKLFKDMSKTLPIKKSAGRTVQIGLKSLVVAIDAFASSSLEHYNNFEKAPKEAPYFLMRKLDVLSNVPSDFGFSPKKDDPWNGGTAYQEMYKQACVAITLQCRDFVNNKGKIKK